MNPDRCNKCNGTGYIPEYKHIQEGICFSCWGTGITKKKFSGIKAKSSNYSFIEPIKVNTKRIKVKYVSTERAKIDLDNESSILKEVERFRKQEESSIIKDSYDESYVHSFYSDDEYIEETN